MFVAASEYAHVLYCSLLLFSVIVLVSVDL